MEGYIATETRQTEAGFCSPLPTFETSSYSLKLQRTQVEQLHARGLFSV